MSFQTKQDVEKNQSLQDIKYIYDSIVMYNLIPQLYIYMIYIYIYVYHKIVLYVIYTYRKYVVHIIAIVVLPIHAILQFISISIT